MFMALSADTQPHFSTLAGFISSMSEKIPVLFRDVLLYCDEMGLIGPCRINGFFDSFVGRFRMLFRIWRRE